MPWLQRHSFCNQPPTQVFDSVDFKNGCHSNEEHASMIEYVSSKLKHKQNCDPYPIIIESNWISFQSLEKLKPMCQIIVIFPDAVLMKSGIHEIVPNQRTE